MTNPYAPPSAAVSDVSDPAAGPTPAGRGVRLAAVILDGIVGVVAIYVPMIAGVLATVTSGDRSEFPAATMAGLGVAAASQPRYYYDSPRYYAPPPRYYYGPPRGYHRGW